MAILDVVGQVVHSQLTNLLGNPGDFGFKWKLQRRYLFEFYTMTDISGIKGTDVARYLQSVSFGQYDMNEVLKVRYGSLQRGYSGNFDIQPIIATYLAPIPDFIIEYFMGWKDLIVNSKGQYFPKSNYAKAGKIIMHDRDGSVSATFKVTGLFPTVMPSYDLDYKADDLVIHKIQFNVDNIYKE